MSKEDNAKKVKALRWKGVLSQSKPIVRRVVLLLIAVSCVALTSVQFGFAGIGAKGDYSAYVVVLLQPLALGAMFFGPLVG